MFEQTQVEKSSFGLLSRYW